MVEPSCCNPWENQQQDKEGRWTWLEVKGMKEMKSRDERIERELGFGCVVVNQIWCFRAKNRVLYAQETGHTNGY